MARDIEPIYIDNSAITSGFFNANEAGDRVYDADSVSSLFDGLITDGIFDSIGDKFVVSANAGMIINVGSGKAWFNRIWLNNDATVSVELQEAAQIGGRIDTVIIEINKNLSELDEKDIDRGRAAHIAVLTGFVTENPVPPTLIREGNIFQYPLANITIPANTTEITDSMIENLIGTEDTPLVTGLLEHMDIAELLQQYSADAREQMATDKAEFEDWFEHLQDELDEEQATNLQNQINDIMTWINSIGEAEQEEY